MDHEEKNGSQKAKFIFLSVAGLVVLLLIVSFAMANRARSERIAAQKELEACKQDNAKLTQFLDEQTKDLDKLKKQVDTLQARAKAKPKSSAKGKTTGKSASKKKTSKSK